jgi:thiamine biosynthesis lipoprotein
MDALLCTRRRALLAGALGAATLAGCGRGARGELAFSGETMGTTYHVKVAPTRLGESRIVALQAAVNAAFERVERAMSLHRADSELVRFGRHHAAAPFALSRDLFGVLAAAQEVSVLSGGAFDVTVAPLVASWGFGPDGRHGVPERAELLARRRAVGYRALRLDAATRSATKAHASVSADLNGIAKGYGVDLAAQALEAQGIEHYLVEAGGEVRARGMNADGRAWQIGIERPDALPPRAQFIAPLTDGAMATSGDYRIYFERDGRRYCHEIDPARAAPIDHGLASVTVVAGDCMRADALATALIVLGPDAGHALAQAHGIAAYFIRRRDGTLHDRMTSAFAALGGRRADDA